MEAAHLGHGRLAALLGVAVAGRGGAVGEVAAAGVDRLALLLARDVGVDAQVLAGGEADPKEGRVGGAVDGDAAREGEGEPREGGPSWEGHLPILHQSLQLS